MLQKKQGTSTFVLDVYALAKSASIMKVMLNPTTSASEGVHAMIDRHTIMLQFMLKGCQLSSFNLRSML